MKKLNPILLLMLISSYSFAQNSSARSERGSLFLKDSIKVVVGGAQVEGGINGVEKLFDSTRYALLINVEGFKDSKLDSFLNVNYSDSLKDAMLTSGAYTDQNLNHIKNFTYADYENYIGIDPSVLDMGYIYGELGKKTNCFLYVNSLVLFDKAKTSFYLLNSSCDTINYHKMGSEIAVFLKTLNGIFNSNQIKNVTLVADFVIPGGSVQNIQDLKKTLEVFDFNIMANISAKRNEFLLGKQLYSLLRRTPPVKVTWEVVNLYIREKNPVDKGSETLLKAAGNGGIF